MLIKVIDPETVRYVTYSWKHFREADIIVSNRKSFASNPYIH